MTNELTIAGHGGGKKKGGGGAARPGVEAPNTLRSRQYAKVVDLLGEGPIDGLVGGAQGIFFDGSQVQNDDGTYNVRDAQITWVNGYQHQPRLPHFSNAEAESAVSVRLRHNQPVVRTITNNEVDQCRVTVSVPSLSRTDKTNGDVTGAQVVFLVEVQANGGGFQVITDHYITGKTNSRYQRSLVFRLPGTGPWDVRLTRLTEDSQVQELQNDLYWDSMTEIIETRLYYPNSALVGVTIDAEQFSSIPKRVYDVRGLLVRIPTNYDPIQRTYSGVWDGTFKFQWTNNPAWVFYDLVLNPRYGLGEFIAEHQVDKWSLYEIARYCDELVPDGRGGLEPRWTCNVVISSQQEAFDLLQSIASMFRGFSYWAGGSLVAVADMPKDPVGLYTNANVIDGLFTYQGSDIRARHSVALVSWNDPTNLGERRVAYVDDPEAVARFGVQKTDIIGVGCTSESQAHRIGRWALFTEQMESEVVTFKAGVASAWARPGDVVEIADRTISGDRMGGRVMNATQAVINIDHPVNFDPNRSYWLSCVVGEGRVETRPVAVIGGETQQVIVSQPFSLAPVTDSVWVLTADDLHPTTWRVITVREEPGPIYEITAVRHNPGKYAWVEYGVPLPELDYSAIEVYPPAPKDIKVQEELYLLSPVLVGVRITISWQSTAQRFEVGVRREGGALEVIETPDTSLTISTREGRHEISIRAINSIGRKGKPGTLVHSVIGRLAPPSCPTNFSIQVSDGLAHFTWERTPDLDVKVGGTFEVRYSPRQDGYTAWETAVPALQAIPGSATSVEMPYRSGTYLIKARDSSGIYSDCGGAMIISEYVDSRYRGFIRIAESPDWLGTFDNTEIYSDNRWLIISGGAAPGGRVVAQEWHSGRYYFANKIDIKKKYQARFAVDVLAFPWQEGDAWIDTRPGLVDDWQDWDDVAAGSAGLVNVYIRTTDDDPASSEAVWKEWSRFVAGEYIGRGFEFMVELSAPPASNIGVEELAVIAELRRRHDSGSDLSYTGEKKTVTFNEVFYFAPSISVTLEEAQPGDNWKITNKTPEGFDIEFFQADGTPANPRQFDWMASGY
jgi:predicted phage tail protein